MRVWCVRACGTCVHAGLRVRGRRRTLGILFYHSAPYSLETVPLTGLKPPVLLGGLAKKFLPSPSPHPTTLELQEHAGMTSFYVGARDSNTGPQVSTGSTLTY